MTAHATRRVLLSLAAPGLCALLLACGGPAPQPQAAPSQAEPTQSPAEAAPSPPEPVGPTEPYAEVREVMPGKDDPADRRAHIEVFNPTKSPCSFSSYTLSWPGGSKTMPLEKFTIDPETSRQRTLILHPNDGDLGALSVQAAQVKLEAHCGP